jgi:hypothetical protein
MNAQIQIHWFKDEELVTILIIILDDLEIAIINSENHEKTEVSKSGVKIWRVLSAEIRLEKDRNIFEVHKMKWLWSDFLE